MDEHALGQTAQRFLRYVRMPTQSDDLLEGKVKPTTPGQMAMLRELHAELLTMGADPSWIKLNERGVLMLEVPATPGRESDPHRTYGAHVDTYKNGVPEVAPLLHLFEGQDIVLPRDSTVIKAADIAPLKGKTIITSSGDSVLGADDKAGCAGIMEALKRIFDSNLSHGPFLVVFFTDEELGGFIEPDDIPESMKTTSCLLTVDGSTLGEIDDGCFSGREVKVTYRHPPGIPARKHWQAGEFKIVFKGKDAHPGGNGKAIVPSHYAACNFCCIVSADEVVNRIHERPFLRVTSINGEAAESTVTCVSIVRDKGKVDKNAITHLMKLAEKETARFPGVKAMVSADNTFAPSESQIETHFALGSAATFVFALVDEKLPSPWEPADDRSFQYAYKVKGDGDKCVVTCIPRAYLDTRSLQLVDELMTLARNIVGADDLPLGPGVECDIKVTHTYTSTKDAIDAHREVLDPIVAALAKNELKAEFKQTPGGTDGAMFNLRFPVPSPNLGTGAQCIHQKDEYICAEDLELLTLVLIDIMTA